MRGESRPLLACSIDVQIASLDLNSLFFFSLLHTISFLDPFPQSFLDSFGSCNFSAAAVRTPTLRTKCDMEASSYTAFSLIADPVQFSHKRSQSFTHRYVADYIFPTTNAGICVHEDITSKVPFIPGRLHRGAYSLIHEALYYLTGQYCAYLGLRFDVNITQFLFGPVQKWMNRTDLDLAAAMQKLRAVERLILRVLCGEKHPISPSELFPEISDMAIRYYTRGLRSIIDG